MINKYILVLCLGVFFFSGCSKILIPYEENALCNVGKGVGYCGSVSDVYDEITQKEQGNNND